MNTIKSVFTTIWEKINQRRFLWLVIIAVILFFLLNAAWHWLGLSWPLATGFGEYWIYKINPATNTAIEKEVHYRTLWDWMQLLIIPLVLALGAFWLNKQERENEQKISEERNQNEQKLTLDRQRETALQTFIDRMTDLLLRDRDGLRESPPEDEIRTVARIRTLTTLRALDDIRKGLLIQFLKEAQLIDKNNTVVILKQADLRNVLLREIDLNNVDLSDTTLNKANLFKTQLNQARLRNTDLFKAYMIKAQLNRADLGKASLIGATLIEADLSEARLKNANLSGAQLIGANLSLADLTNANLTRINLSRANLTNANLTGADLTSANLNGADLTYAIITEEQLSRCRSMEKATLPDGSVHE